MSHAHRHRCTHHLHRRGRVELVVMLAVALTAGVVSLSVGLHQRQAHRPKANRVATLDRSASSPSSQSLAVALPRRLAPPQSQPIAAQQMVRYLPSDNYTAELLWTPAGATAQPTPAWANTTALVEQVERLRREIPREPWPNYVLDALARMQTLDPNQERDAIDELAMLASSPPPDTSDESLRARIQSTYHAVRRRAEIWQQLHRIVSEGNRATADEINPYAMWVQIQETVDAIPYPQSLAWRDYLQMEELEIALRREPATSDELAQMARRVLERLHSPRLDARQRQLLCCAEVDHLSAMLRACASRPADVAAVVNAIEQYEQSGGAAAGGELAQLAYQMRWSVDPQVAELARRIDQLYRRPNMRISVSGELLNRLLSQPLLATAPVQQQTPQAQIVGERKSSTDLSVELLPADNGWRMQLRADGTVTADTTVLAGAATFFVTGNGRFQARKRLSFDNSQIDLTPSQATGDFDMSLAGYQTSMDALPLVRRVARDTALAQYQQQQAAARRQVQVGLCDEAKRTLDEQVAAFVGNAGRGLSRMRSRRCAISACRLCRCNCRPRPSGSSATIAWPGEITSPPMRRRRPLRAIALRRCNFISRRLTTRLGRMKLGGRSAGLRDICRDFCAAWGLTEMQNLDSVPAAMALHFAGEQPLRVDFRDGEAQVVVRLAGFSIADKQWRDLNVRCAYRLDADSRSPALVRVDKVQVAGSRLGVMDQIVLDRVFTRLAAAADRIPLLPEQLTAFPGMADVSVTQAQLADGWLALAVGDRSQ